MQSEDAFSGRIMRAIDPYKGGKERLARKVGRFIMSAAKFLKQE